ADVAFAEAFARVGQLPIPAQNHMRCSYGFAVHGRRPKKAREAFEEVLKREPQHPWALYGQALVAVEQSQTEEAIGFLDQAIAAAPQFMEARRHRAIQLARCGRSKEASEAINWCLQREPQVGATLYAAACVDALTASRLRGTASGTEAAERAFAFLRQAFAFGYGREGAQQD